MNILITAGGTSEKIDSVRSITNHSTGRLGCLIAEFFLEQGHEVTYITTPQAIQPTPNNHLFLTHITTTYELEQCLLSLFKKHSFDAIIHSMAVSDFSPKTILSQEEFIQILLDELATHIQELTSKTLSTIINQRINQGTYDRLTAKKISSKAESTLLVLKRNPKIIAMIREKQPQALLVGFKLLVGVSQEELLLVGKEILVKNKCDFVLANDLETITKQSHIGFLIDAKGQITTAETKKDIAKLIVQTIEQRSINR